MKDKQRVNEIDTLKSDYIDKLSTDVSYSLEVDPLNVYKFSDVDKKFIKLMVNSNDVAYVCKLLKISIEDGQQIYFMDGVRSEIMRLKSAVYHRQFAGRMLNLDEIGGFLTAVLMDNVLDTDRADIDQKIKVSKLLIDLNDRKNKVIDDPTAIDIIPNDIDNQIKELSVDAIKSLLDVNKNKKAKSRPKQNGNDDTKDGIISQIKEKDNLSDDEAESLKSLSTKELLELLNGGV